MNNHIILATIGHTAAGKTTLSRFLVKQLLVAGEEIIYVEEGKIKRDIIGAYSTSDSLNEELRDMAYRKAIDIAASNILCTDVLIDASFHKLERRQMLYETIINNTAPKLIWLYCYCPDISKVEKRIAERKVMKKEAYNQADSMDIYYHIVRTFDLPYIKELPQSISGAIIYLNTDENRIDKIETHNTNPEMMMDIERIINLIKIQHQEWRLCPC